jgi:hypothetical protein
MTWRVAKEISSRFLPSAPDRDFFSRARIVQPGSAEIPRAPVQGKG